MTLLIRIINKLIRVIYYRNPINIYIGQKFFGNDSGLIANLVGSYILWRDRISGQGENNFTSDIKDCSSKLKKGGLVNLGKIISDDIINEIRNDLDHYSIDHPIPDSFRLEFSSVSNNYLFYKQFPGVKKLLNEKIKKIIECYYDAYFQILNTHLYRIFPVIQNDSSKQSLEAYGSTEYWHNDGTTIESIKMFVLLDDVSEDNGPMHIISKNDTKDIVKDGFSKNIEGKSNGIIDKTKDVIKFTGLAGSVLLANANLCLHRADIPKEGLHRDMLVFYITISKKPLSLDWEKTATKHQYLGFKRIFLN